MKTNLLALLISCFCLVGCGSSEEKSPYDNQPMPETTTNTINKNKDPDGR